MFLTDSPGKGESVGYCLALLPKYMGQGQGLVLGWDKYPTQGLIDKEG